MESKLDMFKHERERLNKILSDYAGHTMKELIGLDFRCYQSGNLPEKTKELIGLVSSLVLRCDDCVNYHLGQCLEKNVSDGELVEALTIGLIVGGSITIPHIRRAFDVWSETRERYFKENKTKIFKDLLVKTVEIIKFNEKPREALQKVCELLEAHVPYYDWVGIYFTRKNKTGELFLGPYIGEQTEHNKISFGIGICGQAAVSRKTFIVQDVTKEFNYLSCSLDVKSEIVVPIFETDTLLGEIDIDSHTVEPFTNDDSKMLEELARIIADKVKEYSRIYEIMDK